MPFIPKSSFHKCVSRSSKKILCKFQVKEVGSQVSIQTANITSELSSVNNIRPNDVAILSRCPSGFRSFELFKIRSIWMSQQCVRTLISVWQVKEFFSQTQIWEDSCNHPEAILDKARRGEKLQLSGCRANTIQMPVLIMKITCRRCTTIRTLGQHRPEAVLIWYCMKHVMESRLHSCLFGRF